MTHITPDQIERNREAFRERGRQARRDGLQIMDCPCHQDILGEQRRRWGCSEATEWINGWHEEDSKMAGPKEMEFALSYPGATSQEVAWRIAKSDLAKMRLEDLKFPTVPMGEPIPVWPPFAEEQSITERCTEIADQVVPEYRAKPRSCTGHYAKRWQAAWDGACVALGGDPAEYRR